VNDDIWLTQSRSNDGARKSFLDGVQADAFASSASEFCIGDLSRLEKGLSLVALDLRVADLAQERQPIPGLLLTENDGSFALDAVTDGLCVPRSTDGNPVRGHNLPFQVVFLCMRYNLVRLAYIAEAALL